MESESPALEAEGKGHTREAHQEQLPKAGPHG